MLNDVADIGNIPDYDVSGDNLLSVSFDRYWTAFILQSAYEVIRACDDTIDEQFSAKQKIIKFLSDIDT